MPRVVRGDNGKNLVSRLCHTIYDQTGVDLSASSAYHPQSQGLVERIQGTLVQMLRASHEGGSQWPHHIPFLLYAYRATPHRVTGLSPAALLYGRELRLPAQLDESPHGIKADPDLPLPIREYAERLHSLVRSAWTAAYDASVAAQELSYSEASKDDAHRTFEPDDWVVRRLHDRIHKLQWGWHGPYRIEARLGDGSYSLRDLENQLITNNFHASDLRPYRTQVNEEEVRSDEYVVEQLLDRRLCADDTRQYKVQWKGYAKRRATWEPESDLRRRCAELVDEFDSSHPGSSGRSRPSRRAKDNSDRPVHAPPPPAPRDPAPDSEDLPCVAQFSKGRWQYGRNISTQRGHRLRWFDSSAFTPAELESTHFAALRAAAAAAVTHTVGRDLVALCVDHFY